MGAAEQANYQSQLAQNAANAQQNVRQGLAGINRSGMGGPSGAVSSLKNSALQGQQGANSQAYKTGLENTQQAGFQASQGLSGLQSIYNPNQYYQTAIGGGQAQNQGESMGLGNIMGMAGAGASFL